MADLFQYFEAVQAWVVAFAGQVAGVPFLWAAPMMLLLAVADSCLISLPELNDIITVTRIVHNPYEVYYFPLFPAIGSLAGSYILYRVARHGHDFVNRRFHPRLLKRADDLFNRWGWLALAVPALLPPPLPFKVFVASAGMLGYPAQRFLLAIGLARLVRYYFWGIAAYIMRERVLTVIEVLKSHLNEIFLAAVGLVALILIVRWIFSLVRNRYFKVKPVNSISE